jgi:hypothetical protein
MAWSASAMSHAKAGKRGRFRVASQVLWGQEWQMTRSRGDPLMFVMQATQ